ncbi:DNA-binding beta-propeller fold protein YncE [Bradyrhizobium sp. RT6a]|uniref:YncE family protein n=1 Tax=Bradyrhizobium sp. RT6a TaxID=3156381 RepID=UPI00339A359D
MPLKSLGVIAIPNGLNSDFDHAAFDPKTRRVFIAHTACDCLEVIDHDRRAHIATLPGFPGVAGAVADDGQVLTTNRGAATITWLDAATYEIKGVFPSGPRPNGAAILKRRGIGVVACIGDAQQGPTLQVIDLKEITQRAIDLPGRPRWCVTDAGGERIFVCIRDPSMILAARLPDLANVLHWPLPSGGAHGLDIDHSRHRLYAACDNGELVEVDSTSGQVTKVWPIAGPPDVTFFNPATGRVHVAIGEPGVIDTIHPETGECVRTPTGAGAHTTAIAAPNRLYVVSPVHGGLLVFSDD